MNQLKLDTVQKASWSHQLGQDWHEDGGGGDIAGKGGEDDGDEGDDDDDEEGWKVLESHQETTHVTR